MGKNNKGKALLVGTILGAAGALFLSKKENRDAIKERYNLVKDILTDPEKDRDEKIKAVFGVVSDDTTQAWEKAKDAVSTKVAQLKGGFDKIDKKKYQALVDEVVEDFKKEQLVPKDKLPLLSEYLMKDFKKLSKAAKKPTKTSHAKVKRA